jgi:hypothetical protein
MMIRPARGTDLAQLMHLLQAFAQASLLDCTEWTKIDYDSANRRLADMIQREYLMVMEVGGHIGGMIGAIREQDPWISHRRRLRELFWWVDPAYRGTRASAELFVRWQQDSERFIRDKLVDQVSLSTQPGSSNIDLSRRGWRCIETHWIKE